MCWKFRHVPGKIFAHGSAVILEAMEMTEEDRELLNISET